MLAVEIWKVAFKKEDRIYPKPRFFFPPVPLKKKKHHTAHTTWHLVFPT